MSASSLEPSPTGSSEVQGAGRLALAAWRNAPGAYRLALCASLCALVWLWYRLIDHLRIEWAVNPQYGYGWAVPILCLYLLWDGARREARGARRKAQGGKREPQDAECKAVSGKRNALPALRLAPYASRFALGSLRFPLCTWLLTLCALLFAPTRLVQEANPEWRLVSWALALEVIGITLVLVRLAFGARRLALSTFAVCFFLVAVPWPTVVEGPLIQGLTRANVATTLEVLSAIGIPAVAHGNIIEVSTGVVGVDDACSGIRSFQATLMISLFLGQLYTLSAKRRALCVLMGFALSFGFNVARTTLLTWVAARRGTAAIANWHDPAGTIILVACFLALWLLAVWLAKREAQGGKREAVSAGREAQGGKREAGSGGRQAPCALRLAPRALRLAVGLCAWFLVVEVGTELWYRVHEWRVPIGTAWHPEFPRENASLRLLPFAEQTRQFLRYDEGVNGAWQEGDGTRWQMIFLRWDPGRIAVHLAKSHTPSTCLTAAGREIVTESDLHTIPVRGLKLPFRSYLAKGEGGEVHVFYCLWEDRAVDQGFDATSLNLGTRLGPVLAGRRNSGQRSLEVAVWGIRDTGEAEAALQRQLDKLIIVGK